MCNIKWRHICLTIVAMEERYVLHILNLCVCSRSYLACKANAPYYVICDLSGSTILSRISHKWHDFGEKVIEHKKKVCVVIFSSTFA